MQKQETPTSPSEDLDVGPLDRSLPHLQENVIIPLHAEDVLVSRRTRETATVRIATETRNREHQVDEDLAQERVVIERIPFGHVIASVPPVREEGDTTIMPVVEEVVVIERRLVLKEEVHIRRIRTVKHHRETVLVREQQATVTRTPIDES